MGCSECLDKLLGLSLPGCIIGLGLLIWGCVVWAPTAGRDPDLDFSLIEGDCTINTVRFVKRETIDGDNDNDHCNDYFEFEFCLPEWMQNQLSASSPISTRRELQDAQFEPRSFCGCEQQGVQFCTHFDAPECIPCADIADRAACETSGLTRDQGERSCEWWCFDSYENPDPVPACGTTYKSRWVKKNVCDNKCSKCKHIATTPDYAIGQTVPCWEPKDGYSPGSPYRCGDQSGTCYKVMDPAGEHEARGYGFGLFVAGVVLTGLPCLLCCLFFSNQKLEGGNERPRSPRIVQRGQAVAERSFSRRRQSSGARQASAPTAAPPIIATAQPVPAGAAPGVPVVEVAMATVPAHPDAGLMVLQGQAVATPATGRGFEESRA